MQSIIQLRDGSALRLTTAKYYTPSHKVIHEHGVTPDISVPISEEDERKLLEQRVRASLPADDTTEKVAPIADAQLDRAIDVIKGVKLFEKQMNVAKQNGALQPPAVAARQRIERRPERRRLTP